MGSRSATRARDDENAFPRDGSGATPFALDKYLSWMLACCTQEVGRVSCVVCHTRKQQGRTMQRVVLDPIPFLILFSLILITVFAWWWFKGRK